MKEQIFLGTITSKGQTTGPVEARKALGLDPASKFIYRLIDGRLEIHPLSTTFADLRGSVSALKSMLCDEEIAQIAREDRIEALIAEEGI